MIKLHAGATIADNMLRYAMSKTDMEDYIRRQLANKLVDVLLDNDDFQKNIVKREQDLYSTLSGATIYETTITVLTPAQAKEYQELKDFKERMQWFVK